MKLLSSGCDESSDVAAFSALSASPASVSNYCFRRIRAKPVEALASSASFRLILPKPPGPVAAFDDLAQPLEARIARSSRLEVDENPRQRAARCRPIVNAFFRQPARVADCSPHDVSNRGAHRASHFLSGATLKRQGKCGATDGARVSCHFDAGDAASSRDVAHSRASILENGRRGASPAITTVSALVR
jgi:hypothetical protein